MVSKYGVDIYLAIPQFYIKWITCKVQFVPKITQFIDYELFSVITKREKRVIEELSLFAFIFAVKKSHPLKATHAYFAQKLTGFISGNELFC